MTTTLTMMMWMMMMMILTSDDVLLTRVMMMTLAAIICDVCVQNIAAEGREAHRGVLCWLEVARNLQVSVDICYIIIL